MAFGELVGEQVLGFDSRQLIAGQRCRVVSDRRGQKHFMGAAAESQVGRVDVDPAGD